MAVQTIVATSQANEGYVVSSGSTATIARNGTDVVTANVGGSPTLPPAVAFAVSGGPPYYDYLAFIEFDTSVLAGKVILGATLSVYGSGIGTDTGSQTMQARLYDYGAALAASNWRTPTQFSACTLLAHINKSGMTRLVFGSSLHAAAGTPVDYAGMTFRADSPYQPRLNVTTQDFAGFDGRSRRTYLRR